MRVTHFLACSEAERFAPEFPSRFALRGVGYHITVPAGVVFPVKLPRLHCFARFVSTIGGFRFRLKLYWHSPFGPLLIQRETPIPIEFSGLTRVDDSRFEFLNVNLPSFGRYEIRLTVLQERRIILARDFFEVVSE